MRVYRTLMTRPPLGALVSAPRRAQRAMPILRNNQRSIHRARGCEARLQLSAVVNERHFTQGVGHTASMRRNHAAIRRL